MDLELADAFRRFGSDYLAKYAGAMPPSHEKAIYDIIRWRSIRVSGEEFMRRFLQHVLPKGFHKVRYYGLWHSSNRMRSANVRLGMDKPAVLPDAAPESDPPARALPAVPTAEAFT